MSPLLTIERARMKRTADQMAGMVNGFLLDGAADWFACHRPDALRLLQDGVAEVKRSAKDGTREELMVALEVCAGLFRKAARIFMQQCEADLRLSFSGPIFDDSAVWA